MLAAQVVPMTFLVLPAGVWADRMSRRLLMLVSDLGRARRPGGHGGLLLADTAELWQLIALSAAYGALEAFFRPAAGGLTPALVPPGRAAAGERARRARAERRPRRSARPPPAC